MRPFLAALVLCWHVGVSVMLALPFGSVTAEPAPIRVVTVFVCDPPKDGSRMVVGALIPKLVPTSTITASDITPAQQAAENRKRRTAKR